MNRRVLIIGYMVLDANMGGVRLRRLARLLPRHGWEPVVLTHPRNAGSVTADLSGIRLEEAASPDLTGMYQKLRGTGSRDFPSSPAAGNEPKAKSIGFTSKLNRWLMVPDKQMTWYRPALRRARELCRREKFSAIFASLDPRTCVLVAARLSRETGIPCVLEYRDLWTGSPYYHVAQPTTFHRWLHRRLERKALRQARRVSAVCRGIADYLTRTHGDVLKSPVELNYNFYDPEEYPAQRSTSDRTRAFTVSYMGAMYARRSPHQFFEGMRLFIDRAGLSPEEFRFRWAGGAAGIDDLSELLDRTGVRSHLDFLGQIPHRAALHELMESHVALLIQAPGDAIHIPGKLFEAMGARVPLLALAHPCEAADLVTRCRAGIVCPHTAESVAAALALFYERFRQGERWQYDEVETQTFAAESSVRRLAALLDQAAA